MTSSLYTFKYSSTWLLYVNTEINIAINSIAFSNSRRQNEATVIKISCYHTMLSYHVIIPVDRQIDQQEGDTGSTRKWPLTRPRLPFANSERIHADCLPTFMGPAKITVYNLYNDHKAVLFASRPPDVASVNIVFLFGSQRSYLFILLYETVTSRYGSFHSHRNTICIIINPDISICMTRKTGRRIT